MNYVYSWNGEDNWSEDIGDIQEDILDNDGVGTYTIYRGKAVKPEIDRYLDIDTVIELTCDNLFCEFDDHAEGFISKVEKNTEELQKDITDAFKRHMKRQNAEINFYAVTDIEEIQVAVWE